MSQLEQGRCSYAPQLSSNARKLFILALAYFLCLFVSAQMLEETIQAKCLFEQMQALHTVCVHERRTAVQMFVCWDERSKRDSTRTDRRQQFVCNSAR